MDIGDHKITNPKVIQFVNKALKTNDRSFNEKLPNGTEVSFSNHHGINFSFYETRTQTAEVIALGNSKRSPDERLVEQDTKDKVQTGMLTIYKFFDSDTRISVIDFSKSITRGFSLAI
jgi:hypothetical protein